MAGGAVAACLMLMPVFVPAAAEAPPRIEAFCIDFNWGPGGVNGFAPPGLWADASPEAHVQWYKDLGANTIQTFCVSCNGYAWYKGGIVPEQPGLKTDFLTEVVRLGHAEGMRVMGYFCIGANTRWGMANPEMSYGTPGSPHIPYTDTYLAFIAESIRDTIKQTGVDGFMIDWVWNPDRKSTDGKWLDCEKSLYAQLMGESFPGEDALTEAKEVEYGRKAIDRCWGAIHKAAKEADPDCIIWLSCHSLDHPHVRDSGMFKEVDWLMNENPDPARIAAARDAVGPQTRIIQCLCGWGDQHNAAAVLNDAQYTDLGLYGFARPDESSFPPIEQDAQGNLIGNAKNIEALRRAFKESK